jgi:hypothetical protein
MRYDDDMCDICDNVQVEDELRSQLEKKESKIATLNGRLEGVRKELDSQRMRSREFKTEMDHAIYQLEVSEKKREESEERGISETDCVRVTLPTQQSNNPTRNQ